MSLFRNIKFSKQAIETDRRGVWLGRHICYKITQVSKDELNEDRNLM